MMGEKERHCMCNSQGDRVGLEECGSVRQEGGEGEGRRGGGRRERREGERSGINNNGLKHTNPVPL